MSDEVKKEGCGEGGCGSGGGCGSKGRCCKKVFAGIVLLLLGAVIGYLAGGRCSMKSSMCPMSGMSAPMMPPPPTK